MCTINRHGVSMHAKFEMGCDASGKRIAVKNCHNTVIRSINYRKGFTPPKNETRDMKSIIQSAQHTASYSSKSLLLGNFEYPFPTGLYLSRVVQLTRTLPSTDPLLKVFYCHHTGISSAAKCFHNFLWIFLYR